jgi:non-specific serine/threonine protein kinase/serine/threonine-protein kinase
MVGVEGPGPLIADRYRLGPLLGRGGMAEVFDAFDERLERPVAMKVLRPEVAADAEMRRRFEAEARAAARFSHPSVVSVYDSGEDAGRAFLVMERLPGETLADQIRRGPVDQTWLRTVAFDVLAALEAAHDVGLLHRDIKPGNVLITEEDRVKVADFGIAKMMVGDGEARGDETAVGLVLGTPAYLAPERLAGQPATVATDLYALGVVLYEAATGHKPPPGALDSTIAGTRGGAGPAGTGGPTAGLAGAETVVAPGTAGPGGAGTGAGRAGRGAGGAAGAAGAAGGAEAVPFIEPDLARVIRRAMAPRPEDRYPSAAAMAADLRQGELAPTAVANPATTVLPGAFPPAVEPLEPFDRRRALAIAAAVLLAIIALIIILLLLLNSSHHNTPPTTTTTVAPPPPTTAAPATAPPTAPITTAPPATAPIVTAPPSTPAPTPAPTPPPTTPPPTTTPPTVPTTTTTLPPTTT